MFLFFFFFLIVRRVDMLFTAPVFISIFLSITPKLISTDLLPVSPILPMGFFTNLFHMSFVTFSVTPSYFVYIFISLFLFSRFLLSSFFKNRSGPFLSSGICLRLDCLFLSFLSPSLNRFIIQGGDSRCLLKSATERRVVSTQT